MFSNCQYPLFSPRTAYDKGCRCDKCRTANTLKSKKWLSGDKGKEYLNENAERLSVWHKKYKNNNRERDRHLVNAAEAKLRARKKNASVFLTESEKLEIKKIYKECKSVTKSTGIKHHVDHIIPLTKGGLHHPSNLQILTAEENLRKFNKLIV